MGTFFGCPIWHAGIPNALEMVVKGYQLYCGKGHITWKKLKNNLTLTPVLKVKLSEKDQVKLAEKSISIFEVLKKKTGITEKGENYFGFNFRKATNIEIITCCQE